MQKEGLNLPPHEKDNETVVSMTMCALPKTNYEECFSCVFKVKVVEGLLPTALMISLRRHATVHGPFCEHVSDNSVFYSNVM